MSNEKNLVPLDKRTKSEQREICSEGGRASGVSRRRKKSMRQAADLFLSLPVKDRRTWNKIARAGVDPEDIDNQMAVIVGLTVKAVKGDARAAKILVDLLGEDGKDAAGDASENNLLSAIMGAGEVDTDDLPEVE